MKAIIIGIDYVPCNGELKLLELNTNTLLGGYSQIHLTIDFDNLAKYCTEHDIENVKIHQLEHDRVIYDWEGNPVYMFNDDVKKKLDISLANNGISQSEFYIDTSYPNRLDVIDDDRTLDLRQAFTFFSKIDWFAQSKDRLREFLVSMNKGDWMPAAGIDVISQSPPNIPDYVNKIPDKDAQSGIRFFELTNKFPIDGFIEDFCIPDNDKWGFFNEVRYTCVLTELGDIIPLNTHDTLSINRFTFKRANLDDYTEKELRLVYKMPSFGIIGEDTFIQTTTGPESVHGIHLASLSKDYKDVVSYKIDDIDMELNLHQVYENRTAVLENHECEEIVKGVNNFICIPKPTENCIAINDTIVSPRAILPIRKNKNTVLTRATNIKVGDMILNGNLDEMPVESVNNVGLQNLVYPQPINDMKYHRTLVCNDMLVVCESQFFDALQPRTGRSSRYIVGSDLLDQELDMLNYNVNNGTLYNWTNYFPLAKRRTEELLDLICKTFGDEVWTW